jgi:hypothetical protein
MAGTERPQPRCEALAGAIGGAVACTVYDQRPSPCRELQPGEDKCQRARRRHGLPPLGIALPAEVLAPAVAVVAPLPAGALDPMPLAVPAPDPQEPAQPLH